MATFEYTDTFEAPAAAVFAALTDLEARPTWIAGIQQVTRHPSGTSSPGNQLLRGGQVLRLQEREDDECHRV